MAATSDTIFAVIGAIALFGGGGFVALVFYRGPARRAKRELRRAKHWPIESAPEGVAVRVIGRVRAIGTPLVSPVSGRTCVYYRIVVMKPEPLEVLDIAESGQPFLLEDATGVAIIDPASAICALTREPVQKVDARVRLDTPAHRYCEARWKANWGREMQIHELVLTIDDTVAVLGAGTREPIGDASSAVAGYRDAPRTRLRFASSPRYKLRISDDPATVDPTSAR